MCLFNMTQYYLHPFLFFLIKNVSAHCLYLLVLFNQFILFCFFCFYVLFIRKKMCHLLLIKIYVDLIKKTLNVSTNQLKNIVTLYCCWCDFILFICVTNCFSNNRMIIFNQMCHLMKKRKYIVMIFFSIA
jgi:hypothetical protein